MHSLAPIMPCYIELCELYHAVIPKELGLSHENKETKLITSNV